MGRLGDVMAQVTQMGLPFPIPQDAEPWPNGLGFDLEDLEFWTEAGGVRHLRFDKDNKPAGVFGTGDNWVAALADMLTHPKPCEF